MKAPPKISDAEWEVMKFVWRSAPCTAQSVIDALAPAQEWSPATIKTLLNRLVCKRALRFEKDGRAYIYSPAVSETECCKTEAASFLDRVFDGALSPFLAHFAQSGKALRAEDLVELEKILKESRKRS